MISVSMSNAIAKWFFSLFAQNHKWARKRLGGKWEKWYPDCVGPVWVKVEKFTRLTGRRPGGCFHDGCEEEDYTNV